MTTEQRFTVEALRRTHALVTASFLPAPFQFVSPGFHTQVRALREALQDIDHHAVVQHSGERGRLTVYRAHLRTVLRVRHLRPIRQIAMVLAQTNPGLPHLARLPHILAGEEILLGIAKATLQDVAPFHSLFVDKGLPPDFLNRLGVAIDDVEQAMEQYHSVHISRVASTEGLKHALKAGKNALRCLSVIVEYCCAADREYGDSVLYAWTCSTRIRRRHQKRSEKPAVAVEEQVSEERLVPQNVPDHVVTASTEPATVDAWSVQGVLPFVPRVRLDSVQLGYELAA